MNKLLIFCYNPNHITIEGIISLQQNLEYLGYKTLFIAHSDKDANPFYYISGTRIEEDIKRD